MPDQSPTTRLREIVEAATNGGLDGLHATPDFGGITLRLARAVADPAFVEKVADIFLRLPIRDHVEQLGELDDLRRREAARAVLSLLAAHALGEGS